MSISLVKNNGKEAPLNFMPDERVDTETSANWEYLGHYDRRGSTVDYVAALDRILSKFGLERSA